MPDQIVETDKMSNNVSGSGTMNRIKAGMFSLPLSINQQFFDQDIASTLVAQHEVYLQENQHRPHRFAIRNFLAVFHFRLGNIFKACEYFKTTLREDESNVNALADLGYVYQKLYQHTDAEQLLAKLKSLTDLPDNASSEVLYQKRWSRHIAETGYMYAHDINECTISTERHQQACDMYTAAIRLSETVDFDEQELQDWQFCRGLLYRSMCNIHMDFNTGKFDNVKELYLKAKNDFEPNMDANNRHRRADACSIYGSLMAKYCSRGICRHDEDINNRRHKKERKRCPCQQTVNELYKRALQTDPENVRTYVRYGRELTHSCDFEAALLTLNQAIVLDGTNWFAYSSRATVYIQKYTRGKDRGYLILAEADLLKSVQSNPSPVDLGRLGHVYHLLGLQPTGLADAVSNGQAATENKKYLLKALHYFMSATEIADGNMRQDIHFNRGKCLLDMDEHRGAVESFKKALECEQPNSKTLKNVESLITSLFDMYTKVADGNRQEEILAELSYWWRRGFENKPVENCVNRKKNSRTMLKILEAFLKKQGSDQNRHVTATLKRILGENKHRQEEVRRLLSKYPQDKAALYYLNNAITPITSTESTTDATVVRCDIVATTFAGSGSRGKADLQQTPKKEYGDSVAVGSVVDNDVAEVITPTATDSDVHVAEDTTTAADIVATTFPGSGGKADLQQTPKKEYGDSVAVGSVVDNDVAEVITTAADCDVHVAEDTTTAADIVATTFPGSGGKADLQQTPKKEYGDSVAVGSVVDNDVAEVITPTAADSDVPVAEDTTTAADIVATTFPGSGGKADLQQTPKKEYGDSVAVGSVVDNDVAEVITPTAADSDVPVTEGTTTTFTLVFAADDATLSDTAGDGGDDVPVAVTTPIVSAATVAAPSTETATDVLDTDVETIRHLATFSDLDSNDDVTGIEGDCFTFDISTPSPNTTPMLSLIRRSESRTMITIGTDGISMSPIKDHPARQTCSTEQKSCSIADVVLFICKQLDVLQNTTYTGSKIPDPPSASKSRFDYDFFAVFSQKQKEWVYYSLLARLEQTYKFKGCIPARDFILGETICENIEKAVERSACTLLVIDKEFCEDHELRHRLTYAYYINARLKRRLIPILKEHPRDVPMEICNLTPLNATTTINFSKLARDIEIASLEDRR